MERVIERGCGLDAFTCVLANAAQIAHVPGRKTDVKDCVGIAQRLEHGLVRGSVVPPGPIRELRDLTRYRAALIGEHTRETNRLQKVLEDAGIKWASVARDVLGVSGRALLDALAAVALALNTRPRKTLGWRTPAEALDEVLRSAHTGSVATAS